MGQLFLTAKSVVHLSEDGHATLSVDGKSSYRGKEHDVSITVTIASSELKLQASLSR